MRARTRDETLAQVRCGVEEACWVSHSVHRRHKTLPFIIETFKRFILPHLFYLPCCVCPFCLTSTARCSSSSKKQSRGRDSWKSDFTNPPGTGLFICLRSRFSQRCANNNKWSHLRLQNGSANLFFFLFTDFGPRPRRWSKFNFLGDLNANIMGFRLDRLPL